MIFHLLIQSPAAHSSHERPMSRVGGRDPQTWAITYCPRVLELGRGLYSSPSTPVCSVCIVGKP